MVKKFRSINLALLLGLIVYIFISFFLTEKISYSFVNNKIFEFTDFDRYELRNLDNKTSLDLLVQTDNLTRIQLYYLDPDNKTDITVQIEGANTKPFVTRLVPYTDDISIAEITFNPPLKNNKNRNLKIRFDVDSSISLLASPDNTDILFNKQYGLSKKLSYLIYVSFFIVCILFLIFSLFIIYKLKRVYVLYIIFALIFGVINMFVSMPLGQPDAITHYESIYNFSNRILGIESEEGYILKRKCDLELLPDYYDDNLCVIDHTWTGYFKSAILYAIPRIKNKPDCSLVKVKKFTTVPPRIEYIPQALLMSLGRILNLNQFIVYLMVLWGNYLLMIYIISQAVKYAKDKQVLFFFLGLHPGILGIIQSVTYDAVVYSLALLVISLAYNIFTSDNVSVKFRIISCIAALLLLPMKTVYFPISLLVFAAILDTGKFEVIKSKTKNFVCPVLVIILGALVIYLACKNNTGNSFYSISYIIKHPVNTIKTALRTLFLGSEWFNFRGTLIFSSSIVINALLLVVIFSNSEIALNKKQLYLFILAYVLVFAFIFCAFLGLTPLENTIIYGMQCRYFYPIAVLAFLCISQMCIGKIKIDTKLLVLVIVVVFFTSLLMNLRF